MRILVVDDDQLAAQITGAILESCGNEIVIAANGIEAIERLNADASISLVVSDQNMPLVSGLELFDELRRQGVTLPFVLLTGEDPAFAAQKERRLDACLLKDDSLREELPRAIEHLQARG